MSDETTPDELAFLGELVDDVLELVVDWADDPRITALADKLEERIRLLSDEGS
jgi:hypothetical protein